MIANSRPPTTQVVPPSETARSTILVVDDDPMVLRVTCKRLERCGYRVVACGGGSQALARLEEETFDAVVSDVRMPGTTGMDLLRAVRERGLTIPVLLVTGDPTFECAAEAAAYGVFEYLAKPVPSGDMEAAVERAANLGRQARLKADWLDEAASGVFPVLAP